MKINKRWTWIILLFVAFASFAWFDRNQGLKEKALNERALAKVEVGRQTVAQWAKADQEASAAKEQKEYEALPIEAQNRIQYGKLINSAYQLEGRRMTVRATEENF